MTTTIKRGDRVRVRSGRLGGTVTDVLDGSGLPIQVTWDGDSRLPRTWHREADLVLFAPAVAAQFDTTGWTLQVRMVSPTGQEWDSHTVIPTKDVDAARAARTMLREYFREMASAVVVRWWDDRGR